MISANDITEFKELERTKYISDSEEMTRMAERYIKIMYFKIAVLLVLLVGGFVITAYVVWLALIKTGVI